MSERIDRTVKVGEYLGMEFRVDPEMAEGEMELRDPKTGRVLIRVVNIGAPASRTEETPPEARLAAFAKRYDAQSVSVSYDVHAPPFEDPWDMAWRRRYADGALSDWRETVASSFAGLISAAEEIEAENDKREPQYAGPASEPNGSAEGSR